MRLPRLVTLAAASSLSALALASTAAAQSTPPSSPPKAEEADSEKKAITVVGDRVQVRQQVDRTSFDVSSDIQAQTGTLADALRAVPGVEVDFEGNVSLRGNSNVKILVDGQEAAMFSGPGRASIISSMPAGQVERVEIINNPSAAMSPEGSAGIINLVMKRARPQTRSATVQANAGGFARNSLSLNVVDAGQKLTTSVDLARRNFAFENGLVQERTDLLSGATSEREVENDFRLKIGTARVGLDYALDGDNRLSLNLSHVSFRNLGDVEELVVDDGNAADLTRDTDMAMRVEINSGRLAWRRSLSGAGHELLVEGSLFGNRFERETDTVEARGIAAPLYELFVTDSQLDKKAFKADYKRPMGDEKMLNIGYQGDFSDSRFDSLGERGLSRTARVTLAPFTNIFDYDERIHAVFGTYNFRLGELEALAGLRVEKTDTDINQITDNLRFENDYLRAYPTLNLGYDLSPSQKIRAGYSRRIQRPQAQDLNPYTVYLDPQNLRRGNPFLKPQTTDGVEIGWSSRKGPRFTSLTAFYRDTKDGVTDIFTDLGDGVILATRDNLATERALGVDLVASGKLIDTLTYNASATLQHMTIDPRSGGISQERSGMMGSLRGTLNWQPGPKDFVQLNSIYNGRQLLPQGYRTMGAVLNLGYRRKVDERLSLSVTGRNILDSMRIKTVFDTPTTAQRIEQRGAPRMVMIGFNYTIGSTKAKQGRPEGFDFSQASEGPL